MDEINVCRWSEYALTTRVRYQTWFGGNSFSINRCEIITRKDISLKSNTLSIFGIHWNSLFFLFLKWLTVVCRVSKEVTNLKRNKKKNLSIDIIHFLRHLNRIGVDWCEIETETTFTFLNKIKIQNYSWTDIDREQKKAHSTCAHKQRNISE